MAMNLNDSPKYGQLSGADLEILGAREQAATARALRTAYKPTQGQMVGGWYVKPSMTQHLADALMQYNNYQDEKAAREQYKALVGQKKQGMKDVATQVAGLDLGQGIPAHQVNVPAVESGATNAKLDELLAAGYGSDAQGQPLFSDAAPTPSATPSAMPNDGAQAYVAPTAEATGNVNANVLPLPVLSLAIISFPSYTKLKQAAWILNKFLIPFFLNKSINFLSLIYDSKPKSNSEL
jgi:hypothetical protein